MKNKILLTAVSAAALLTAPAGFAMSETGSGAVSESVVAAAVQATGFTQGEKDILRTVFDEIAQQALGEDNNTRQPHKGKNKAKGKGQGKAMPHGLAKRDELPPGLQKHIDEHGTLPPGLEGRALPDEVKRKMPKRNDGTETVLLGDDVVLIEKASRKVLDIIKGVARGSQ